MNKGDKFIVVDHIAGSFKKGDIVECIEEAFIYTEKYRRISDGLTDYLYSWQTKQLDRFPCDDEQPNN